MKATFKALTVLSLATAALTASLSANALPVVGSPITNWWIGGQNTNVIGGDQSGQTSVYVPVSNQITSASFNGYYLETFDYKTRMFAGEAGKDIPGLTSSISGTNNVNIVNNTRDGCAYNGYFATNASTSGGGLGVRKGSVSGLAASPANDSTCFGYVPGNGNTGGLKFSYQNILNFVPGTTVNYLGFYLGSLDTYNFIDLFDVNDNKVFTLDFNNIFAGRTNQSWTDPIANVYVNLEIDPSKKITGLGFRSTGIAFELDNVVVGTAVPEPESIALVGLGLLALAATRRRKQSV